MKRAPCSTTLRPLVSACLVLLCAAETAAAHAWSLNINSGARRLFLHVGNGALSGQAGTLNGGTGTSGIVNTVRADLTVGQLVSGAPQAMTSNSTQSISLYGDGAVICPSPTSQVLIGAGYRRNNSSTNAVLTVSSPMALTDTSTGEIIPITQISWIVSAPGSPTPGVIPSGTFTGGVQTLTTVPGNTYIENCHTYSYANSALRAAGTYTGQVTYTLTSP
ncbi:MAG: hypothetical protein U1E12_05250 [Hydrogenophaga sp.]|uniref:hypothetical protein n=1 Tax=Hydrogenophaga sp. TaxID=1904254 RepID=UPI002AB82B84|nr:hypothetical protein [Hydrogenophaga sp.]MDZ4101067.1 hypothetical protein [Hydrogenophaga sp.]